MKKIRNVFYCLSITSLVLMLMTSCGVKTEGDFDSGNTSSENKTEQSASALGSSLKMDISEQVTVDIPVIEDYDMEQEKIQVNPVNLNIQTMHKKIFPEDRSGQTLETVDDGVESLTTKQGSQIIYGISGWCGGSTKMWDIYNDFIGFRLAEDIKVETAVDGELDFMSKEDAKEKVQSLVKSMEIDFELGDIKVESFSKEYFTELINALENNSFYAEQIKEETKMREWTDADEMYYIRGGFKEQGIPIDSEGFGLRDDSTVMGMQMEFYLTEQGIQSFNVESMMDKGKTENIQICSVEEGLNSIAKKYKNIVTDEKMKIVGAKLEYDILPEGMQGKLYLTPVLKFDTQTPMLMDSTSGEQGKEAIVEETIRVNAETGRIIE